VDVTPAMIPDLTQHDITRLTYGSKLELTAWYSYATLIWCLKFTMLFFYARLTLGSLHNKMVWHLFWICGVAYIAVFLTISLGCYPIQKNWQVVPIPPWKCRFRPQLFVVVAVLNILTDAALLLIPIPLLWKLKLPLRKKLVISLVLSSGLLVITAAIIRVVYSLDAEPSAGNINRWGVRETIIGIIAINIPILRPLFTRAFWVRGSYDPTARVSVTNPHSWRAKRLPESGSNEGDIELGNATTRSTLSQHTSRSTLGEDIVDQDRNDKIVVVQGSYKIQRRHSEDAGSVCREQHWEETSHAH